MSDSSDFASSRCILRTGGYVRQVEIQQEFALCVDMDTMWSVRYRDGDLLQFRTIGFLGPEQLRQITRDLRQAIDLNHGDVAFKDYDHTLEVTVHLDNGSGSLSLRVESERLLDDTGWITSRAAIVIDPLPLEDRGVQELYEWVRHWTQMLQPAD